MRVSAADLVRRLAQNAEAICREYLSNGRREGHTWRVGDADNTPGRSLAVRLTGPDSGKGAAGKWTDFATGEHGDLLDLIARSRRLDNFRDVAEEARRFLSLPETVPVQRRPPAPAGSPEAARRLFASARPIHGSIAETYLRNRGISELRGVAALRFHPNCFYRAREDAPREIWPALIAAVTDVLGTVTGVQRTWLERDGSDKAPIATPRRAMGHLLGNGVRFGVGGPAPAQAEVVAAGEGLETMLSLRCVLPAMPMIAALSATHLAALVLPPGLRRLYVARDDDRSGRRAAEMLADPRRGRRHRGAHALPRHRRLQHRPRRSRARRPRDVSAYPARARRHRPLSAPGPSPWSSGASAIAVVRSALAAGRARPSMGRSGQKRMRPATAARGFLPLAALDGAAIPRETRKPCSPSSAALRPCRLSLWVRASSASGEEIA